VEGIYRDMTRHLRERVSRVTAVLEESKSDTMQHDRRNSVMYEDCPELRFIYSIHHFCYKGCWFSRTTAALR